MINPLNDLFNQHETADDRQQELPLLPVDPGPQSDIDWPPDLVDYADAVVRQAEERGESFRSMTEAIIAGAGSPWAFDTGLRGFTSATEIVVAGLNVETRRKQP